MCNCEKKSDAWATDFFSMESVFEASIRVQPYVRRTPFSLDEPLSAKHQASVFLKREDLQEIRSFKIRGAINKLLSLNQVDQKNGVICASAGNHAQGVAFACHLLKIKCVVLLPKKTPKQKVDRVKFFGKNYVDVRLMGDYFDETCAIAIELSQKKRMTFVHPFDDSWVMSGQGTLALEMISDHPADLDVLLIPVGGGGLASGVSLVYKALSPQTRIVGIEVEGADAMSQALKLGRRTALGQLDSFADGTAVKKVGRLPFEVCQALLDDVVVVTKPQVVEAMIYANNQMGVVLEPSGALSLAALNDLDLNESMSVGCIVSGGNNDVARYPEFLSLLAA